MKLFVTGKEFTNGVAYSTPCSNTDKDTYWLTVQFKKGEEPELIEGKAWIETNNCFFSCFARQDGTVTPKLVVMNYDYSEAPEKKNNSRSTKPRR